MSRKKNADTGITEVKDNTIVVNDFEKFNNHLQSISENLSRSVKIRKAKIKDDLFLEGEYTEQLPGHSKKDSKFSCTVPIHDDLKFALIKLHTHLALLCDEVELKKTDDIDTVQFTDFGVRGFSVGGNDENEGVTISGWKEGKYGTVNLNTPFTKFESDEYPFLSELGADIQTAIHEVEQYLFEGKRAPEKQLEMDFGGEGEEGTEGTETTEE
jgi:hypothetical protein